MMWRTTLFLVLALTIAGCSGGQAATPPTSTPPTSTSTSPAGGHGHHQAPADDPNLVPAGDTGTPALGQLLDDMNKLSSWVRDRTGECTDVAEADDDELADYLGPTRVTWYGPFVGEWATCEIQPYSKLGLVLFEPGQQRALQEFWLRGLASGEISDNPDWAFGNGFAVTAGPLGIERLGLHYLWCEPVGVEPTHTIPADVEGCTYAR
jgi:hypothetical protein